MNMFWVLVSLVSCECDCFCWDYGLFVDNVCSIKTISLNINSMPMSNRLLLLVVIFR